MPSKGDRTRDALLDKALKLFRRRGFDRTTMRDIAREAEMSLGAAYYYFRSKEDIVHAYYDRVQDEHERAVPASWPVDVSLRERLEATFSAKLKVVERDRKFLGALFRYAAEPEHPLGVFTEATRDVRERAIAIFDRALEGSLDASVDAPLRRKIAEALWLAHLGLILHLLHDRSEGAQRTHALASTIATTAERCAMFLALPQVRAVATELMLGLARSAK